MTQTWRTSLSSYDNEELRALTFPTEVEINRAIDYLWGDRALKHAPRDYADGLTMIAPTELASILENNGFRFKESNLVDTATLGGKEIAKMRLKYGM